MNQINRKFKVVMNELENVRQWLIQAFADYDAPESDIQRDILVAITEVFVNFVKHSQLKPDEHIHIQLAFAEDNLTILFKESGASFDITECDEPDLEIIHESGYGIFIVKNLMDSFEYFPKKSALEQNITKITKGFNHGKG